MLLACSPLEDGGWLNLPLTAPVSLFNLAGSRPTHFLMLSANSEAASLLLLLLLAALHFASDRRRPPVVVRDVGRVALKEEVSLVEMRASVRDDELHLEFTELQHCVSACFGPITGPILSKLMYVT